MRRTDEGGGRISNNSTTHKIEIENTLLQKICSKEIDLEKFIYTQFFFYRIAMFFYIFLFRGKFKSAAFRL